MLFMIMLSMKNMHAWMGEKIVVDIVVCVTMKFQNAEREWKHTGNSRSGCDLNKRCKRIAHISRKRDISLPNGWHWIQPFIPSTWSKRIKRLPRMEPKIPSSMWVEIIHKKRIFNRKNHHGSGLVRSSLISWPRNTYIYLYTDVNFSLMYARTYVECMTCCNKLFQFVWCKIACECCLVEGISLLLQNFAMEV